MWLCLLLFFDLCKLGLGNEDKKKFKEACIYDGDCTSGLYCDLEDKLFQPKRICRCKGDLEWVQNQCVDNSQEDEIATIVSILAPILSIVVASILFIVICSCCVHSSNLSVETEMKSKETASDDEDDFDFKPNIQDFKSKSENEINQSRSSSNGFIVKKEIQPRPKTTEHVIKISDDGQERPKTGQNGHLTTGNGHLVTGNGHGMTNGFHEISEKKISMISDPGYQSNMRNLLQRPTSSIPFNNGLSRPASAVFMNLDSRPTSARLNSKSSSANSSRKSSHLNGPYLTQPLRPHHRPRSPMAPLENGQALYDKILAVSEAEDKIDHSNKASNIKEPPKEPSKAKTKKKRLRKEQGIEEIRLVRVAVSAFKKKRRLKDLKLQKKAKKQTFESVVDRVIRLRDDEKRTTYTAKRSLKRSSSSSNTTLTSSLSNSEASLTKVANSRPKRPESVAQRVLRERQEKRISAKTLQTPKQRPKTSASGRNLTSGTNRKQPLHVALRQSASKHAPKAEMAEKIKQKAHFDAVKNFQV